MDQSLQYGEERLLVLADFEPGKGGNAGTDTLKILALPKNATNWRSRWIKACNTGKKGCWFLLILSLVRTKTQVCPIGLFVKNSIGLNTLFCRESKLCLLRAF